MKKPTLFVVKAWPVCSGFLMAMFLYLDVNAPFTKIFLRYLPLSVIGGLLISILAIPIIHYAGMLTNINRYRERYNARKSLLKKRRISKMQRQ